MSTLCEQAGDSVFLTLKQQNSRKFPCPIINLVSDPSRNKRFALCLTSMSLRDMLLFSLAFCLLSSFVLQLVQAPASLILLLERWFQEVCSQMIMMVSHRSPFKLSAQNVRRWTRHRYVSSSPNDPFLHFRKGYWKLEGS